MLKIFLVEDESIVREGLKNNIPWREYGYQFMGEASDGEVALPMIRKIRPDVLITDIKMPFMDGLALSQIVTQEIPDIKIIIISGYDEFEYAQRAIRVGVEQYLLKPITRSGLRKVLLELREKIESEREQKNYLEAFQSEMKEYEDYSRRKFLEKVFGGVLSVQQIYEEAAKLSLDLNGPGYNLVLLHIQIKRQNPEFGRNEHRSLERAKEALLRYFMRFPEYLVFRWNISMFGILIKGEIEQIKEMTERCTGYIGKICAEIESEIEWYVAAGEQVERLSMLPECYTKVNQILAHRFLDPEQHILTQQVMESLSVGKNTKTIEAAESENQGRRILKKGLEYIEENFSEESLSLNSVAGVTEVSANYFSSVFSQEMGMTFIEYVTDKRMEKAKKLLRQTEKHSGEIAAECGYKDAHYFSFVFKKSVGCTPREYRNGK